ncbi:GNAT family N-acetyltransferase [Romboutsia sedimentorum]|uniref:GNAT family N-acetyltransferase n=1 Tax=Romboutsia sedimentorum TaxID=1368474 RepID=A0ABT7E610_9FIRM|nr:GNAT family N-acetyltransferase [Romboutsia sedimentorum]MDK2562370.1 GNAT family N-acetyltransferase [Romboutsia sedimentorum]
MIFETDRLYLREMEQTDFSSLCEILQDEEVMYAYEHAFTNDEVQEWLNRQIKRYEDYGFGLWAVILKDTNEMIGQCGLTMQDCDGNQVLEIGYLLKKKYWHNGYAIESAIGCKNYAFAVLGTDEVYSIIRDNNIASQNVAKRNGMHVSSQFVKHYYNINMLHYIYSIKNSD